MKKSLLHVDVQEAVEKWNSLLLTHFPSTTSWRTKSSDGTEGSIETFLDSLVTAHLSAMSSNYPFDIAPALKHTLQSLVQLAADLVL